MLRSAGLRSAAALMVGTCAYALGQWLLISHLSSRWGLAALGNYSLALSLVTPFTNLAYYGLRSLLAADVRNEFEASDLLRFRTLLFVVLGIAFWIAMLFVIQDRQVLLVILLVFVPKTVEAFSDLCYGAMHKLGRSVSHGLSVLARSALGIVAFATVALACKSFEWGFVALSLAWLGVLLQYDLPIAGLQFAMLRRRPDATEWQAWRRILAKGFPVVFSVCVGALLLNLPSYLLNYFFDAATLGLYTSLFSFCVLINTLCCVLGQAAVPMLARHYHAGEAAAFWRIIAINVGAIAAIVLTAVPAAHLWGEWILVTAFGADLAPHADLLGTVLIAAAPSFVGQFLSFAVNAVGSFALLAKSTLVSVVIVGTLAPFLTSHYGIVGAASAIGLIGLVQTTLFGMELARKRGDMVRRR